MSVSSHKLVQKICVLRLSAIGDVAQVFIAVNELKSSQPQLDITWIIGKTEYELLRHAEDIDFIVFDKDKILQSYRSIARKLFNKRFDALLLMQYSLRANLLSLLIKAPLRIGYPQRLSRECHGLFVNRRIETPASTHVLDVYYGFAEALGSKNRANIVPTYYLPEDARFARQHLPEDKKILLISPCSSHNFKNWQPQRYAAVAQAAMRQHGIHVVLVGGNSRNERIYEQQILQHLHTPCASLIGKTNLRQLAAVVAHSDLVVAPDSAIVHIASAVHTPVIGLYAATNAERSGPYNYLQYCINRYPEALSKYYRKSVADVRWGKRIRKPSVMELVGTQSVIEKINYFIKN